MAVSEGLRSPVRATRTNPTLPVADSGESATTGPWAWAFICWTRLSPGAEGALGAADAWVRVTAARPAPTSVRQLAWLRIFTC